MSELNSTQLSIDEWNVGSYHKTGIWTYYILLNFTGTLQCLILIYLIYKNTKRTASDICTGGLAFACANMSFSCGMECLLSVIHNRFYGGDAACYLEAGIHVSFILMEFFTTAGVSIIMYLNAVKEK